MQDRVLLTGATGFVGRACVEPLRARGYDIHTISTRNSAAPEGVTVWRGDLLDNGAIDDLVRRIAPDALLHAAWDVTHGAYWSAATNFDWLAASTALLRAFRAAGGTRAVGVGTCAEYGWTVPVYAEAEAPLLPASRYGIAKLTLSHVFQSATAFGLSTAWARLFFPFGPREQPGRLLPSVVTTLLAGRPAACTEGTQVRDFLYIDDVGAAVAALLDSGVTGPVNIGAGSGIAVRDLVLAVAAEIGRADLVRLGALPMRDGDPPSIVASTQRLNVEVGFVPAIGLTDAVRRTIAYWAGKEPAGGEEDSSRQPQAC